MDTEAWKILSELLEMADNEFSNHGCNDYEIPNTLANVTLMLEALRWNDKVEHSQNELRFSTDGTVIVTQDYFLMGFFSAKAKELAGSE